MATVKTLLGKLMRGKDLSREEMGDLFGTLMTGGLSNVEMAAALGALSAKGETVEELVAAARVMRAHVTPVQCVDGAIDTCGTGGDGISTFNVSTTAAIIAAAAGATVAKHGSHTNTRASGSAEVFKALGIQLEADVKTMERCLAEARVAFLYAPRLHPAMKHAGPVRKQLGVRTIFNLLGPLTNPAGVKRQLLGVSHEDLTEKVCLVLQELGAIHAMVVYGLDGLCDLTITGETKISELKEGVISTYLVLPEDVGLERAELDALLVRSPEESAAAVQEILDGGRGPRRDHALLNAGAALVVAELADDLAAGIEMAGRAVDSGAGGETLARLVELSGGS